MTKEQNPHTAKFIDFTFPDVTKEGLIPLLLLWSNKNKREA
jgi:hypothetical protein